MGPRSNWCLKGHMLLFRNMNMQYCRLCWCAPTPTHTHTQRSQPLTPNIFTLLAFCRTCSTSPRFNSELQLIEAHALCLAAARPRCAVPRRNHSSSVTWLPPSLAWFLQQTPKWQCCESCQNHLLSHYSLVNGRKGFMLDALKLRGNTSQRWWICTLK